MPSRRPRLRLLARSAAIADAYRNMAQVINEVRVTANTTVERHLTAATCFA